MHPHACQIAQNKRAFSNGPQVEPFMHTDTAVSARSSATTHAVNARIHAHRHSSTFVVDLRWVNSAFSVKDCTRRGAARAQPSSISGSCGGQGGRVKSLRSHEGASTFSSRACQIQVLLDNVNTRQCGHTHMHTHMHTLRNHHTETINTARTCMPGPRHAHLWGGGCCL